MSAAREIRAVTGIGLRSIPARFGTSMVIVIGVAAVVSVLVAALAIATGFRRAAVNTGSPARAVVLAGNTEAASTIARESIATIIDAAGVKASNGGQAIASAEALVFIPLTDQRRGVDAFATLRGVGREAFVLRPEVKMIEGRMFDRGKHELIVGRSVQRRLGGLGVGSKVTLPNGDWTVVGAFESGGDAHESELMTDADLLVNVYQLKTYNSVTVTLDGPDGFERFSAALSSNPTLSVKAQREDEYFAAESRPVSTLLTIVAYGIGSIMAFGAVFGALNTMYSAVSTRAKEIATLRAMGFGAAPVVASVLVEAMLLSLTGALAGALLAWLLLDGSAVSTMTGVTPSQLTFGLQVGPGVILIGIAFAAVIALVGGLFAALRAARVPVAVAMRLV